MSFTHKIYYGAHMLSFLLPFFLSLSHLSLFSPLQTHAENGSRLGGGAGGGQSGDGGVQAGAEGG